MFFLPFCDAFVATPDKYQRSCVKFFAVKDCCKFWRVLSRLWGVLRANNFCSNVIKHSCGRLVVLLYLTKAGNIEILVEWFIITIGVKCNQAPCSVLKSKRTHTCNFALLEHVFSWFVAFHKRILSCVISFHDIFD